MLKHFEPSRHRTKLAAIAIIPLLCGATSDARIVRTSCMQVEVAIAAETTYVIMDPFLLQRRQRPAWLECNRSKMPLECSKPLRKDDRSRNRRLRNVKPLHVDWPISIDRHFVHAHKFVKIVIRVHVDEAGYPFSAALASAEPNDAAKLVSPFIWAAMEGTYKAAVKNGKPIASDATYTFIFRDDSAE